jgi:hypothetical protein
LNHIILFKFYNDNKNTHVLAAAGVEPTKAYAMRLKRIPEPFGLAANTLHKNNYLYHFHDKCIWF